MNKLLFLVVALVSGLFAAADDPVRPEIYRYVGDDKDLGKVELLLFKNSEKKISGYLTIAGDADTLTKIQLKELDFTFTSEDGWQGEGEDLASEQIKVTLYKGEEKYKLKMDAKEADNNLKMTGDYHHRSGPFTDATALIMYQMEEDQIFFSLHYQTKNMVYKKKYVDQWGYAKKIAPNTYHFVKPLLEKEGFYCDFTFKKDDNGRVIFSNNSNCAECLWGLEKGDNIYFETGDE